MVLLHVIDPQYREIHTGIRFKLEKLSVVSCTILTTMIGST